MENWQVAVIVLASVLIGALIPVFVTLTVVLFRAGREIAAIGKRLEPTLDKLHAISKRIESLSRGLDGGEKSIAELLSVVGDLSRGLERNMKMINVVSTLLAAAGPVVASVVQTMHSRNDTTDVAKES